LPRVERDSGTEELAAASRATVSRSREGWPGLAAPRGRTLPARFGVAELPEPPDGDFRVALGLDEENLQPVWHNFQEVPHLMVFGDTETGKTNLLRLVARAVASRYPAAQARIMLADYRRDPVAPGAPE